MTGSDHAGGAEALTTGLGYFSLALGSALLGAPGAVNRLIGVRDDSRSRFWQRLVAAQELSAAAGIFAARRPVPVLWGRTAADVLHITMLARARRNRATSPARATGALAALAGCFAADAYASARMTSDPQATRKGASVHGKAAITVTGSRDEIERRWREFERSGGGDVRFADAPGDRGTELHLEIDYGVPGGRVGQAVKKVTGDDPLQVARDDLRRFKQLVETGEVVRSDGTPVGPSAKTQPKQRPAQPVEHATA